MMTRMKTDLDHLPGGKQRELARVLDIIHEEFADAMATVPVKSKRAGRIQKIVLFGSYARGGWVDEPHTAKGYQSDYDLLIVVNNQRIVEFTEYWYKAEDRLMREPAIKTPVNFIVHTLDEVNNKLNQGQYFFSDIIREGVALYDLKGTKPFVTPKPPTPREALEAAQKYNEQWIQGAAQFLHYFDDAKGRGWNNKAAFFLHQGVESLYTCLLLVLTNYSPSTHNVKFLRSFCEGLDARLIEAWPRETKFDRRCFELLKRAYVEARYSEHYKITEEELTWLGKCADALKAQVEVVCEERLANLAKEAGA